MPHTELEPPPMPEKPKPTLYADLEDIGEAGDIQVGDTMSLKVSAKVTGIREQEYEGSTKTEVTFEINKISSNGMEEKTSEEGEME